MLRAHGVEKGDRVAMLLPPTPETAAAFFGTWKRGAILLSMSVLYGDDGIRHRVSDSQAKVLVTNAANQDRVDPSLVEHVLVLDDELLRPASPDFEREDTLADDPAQLYYTSRHDRAGQGHRPRAPLPARARGVRLLPRRAGRRALPRHGRVGVGGGHRAAARAVALRRGPARLPARGRLRPAQAARLPLAPRGHERLHDADRDALDDDASRDAGTRYPQKFRIVCSAGEPLNPEAIRWFREQYGLTVLDYYGLTESYPLVANYPFMEVREGSMGRPMPGWDVQILDEDEQPVPQGERGEICLRARSNPHYPLGYWRNEEAAQETFGGDWFHTKDAARFDEDGYVWYEGRADDVIIAAGYRIGPFEVESACLEHPAVKEAAAVASPDERRGSVVKAFIVLAEGHEGSDELVRGDPGPRALPAVRLRLPAQDRVRRRPAEDADRQDPPDRAAPARAGGATAERGEARRARARCCRSGWPALVGLAALGAVGALEWQRLVARAQLRARAAVGGGRGGGGGRRAARRARAGAAGCACWRCRRSRSLALFAGYWLSGAGLDLLKPRHWDDLLSGLGGGLQALGTVRLPYVSADPWPRIVLELLGAELLILAGLLTFWPRAATRGRGRACR